MVSVSNLDYMSINNLHSPEMGMGVTITLMCGAVQNEEKRSKF